ncbi:MAG: dTDP-4-keto-6-deoxyglucose-3, 5-epimerase and dTDP-6-deoxy-L-mannose-dehydrogenase [Candidatus Collierbacteria bacterium GW2011_GWB1_44_6]|uniref:dTDP-4-keto-6-deoxyglucose-3, 5-epimerase and dTDP-6-deoxy-L-mannose-dehydrogenase n=2 Tax=Candidatus Collieribacteriota TaxID=1752725 RepID=A0A0G1JQR5_9BACT|nr:MAG: dTDP-4-keto-6-deoxyglucose-3, 5-epimerase and dTDP-6-deoxy-L-mannose-dehydrogenase [Candidatus Collierbacteria bacterium GW2011_GWC2_43_12]KKT73698.1 MAG: dTDP-4-keto-6-deoxyglucose-3, 5-epimerase and dTDP-6-deoxy-L-mannose-dehydrogenase [Candidatus Collierbacteria bacterium GW2011_GWB1_44_6]KKT83466.1 MAG: dTDP-4-keto-6-deoxyglucose-3, 5-epimerase and dTDP-6-deoxy-L-mannose-dehydrogenase [Microgenomates group bacterium GW2011_GWC1_44_9]
MGLKKINYSKISLPKKAELFRQTYDKAEVIGGVIVCKINTFADDFGGWFKEALRLDEDGNVVALKDFGVDFRPIQINVSYLASKTKRFWHIHPHQNEIWTTTGTILLGLIDFRKDSPTYEKRMKIILSPDKMVYIPSGIAHGFINQGREFVTLNYFADHHFSADETTQECRIDPKIVSYDFVKSELM